MSEDTNDRDVRREVRKIHTIKIIFLSIIKQKFSPQMLLINLTNISSTYVLHLRRDLLLFFKNLLFVIWIGD